MFRHIMLLTSETKSFLFQESLTVTGVIVMMHLKQLLHHFRQEGGRGKWWQSIGEAEYGSAASKPEAWILVTRTIMTPLNKSTQKFTGDFSYFKENGLRICDDAQQTILFRSFQIYILVVSTVNKFSVNCGA